MTKEQFVFERDALTTQIQGLYKRSDELLEAYIKEHKQFDKGDKVLLTALARPHPFGLGRTIPESQTIAYVKDIRESRGVILYDFWKSKKDGSKSTLNLWSPHYDKIELIEKAKPSTP